MRFYRGNPQGPSSPRKKVRRLVLAMSLVFSVYLVAAGDGALYQVWHRERQIDLMRGEIEALREENARLQEEVVLLTNDLKTIERIAREHYGMVKANESVYMVYPHPPHDRMEGER